MNGGTIVTRFAPSPTGRLHAGHAWSALLAWRTAAEAGGRFLLRIEDIDAARCREEYVAGIFEDLSWLGLAWEEPVLRQSQHMGDYAEALDRLRARDLLYPCFCTRKEIAAEIARAPSAPHGPEGPLYPGTCRHLGAGERRKRMMSGRPYAWRLDARKAMKQAGGPLFFEDLRFGRIEADPTILGDAVLARKDTPASYHLCVVYDDARQGVTRVIRGDDLLAATHLHVLLQALLGLPAPLYHHHALLTDAGGRRLSKRDGAETLLSMRERGITAAEFIALLAEMKRTD